MTADLSNEALDALVEDLADAIAAAEVDRSTDARDAESTGERFDLWGYEVPLELDRARGLYAAITALRARAERAEAQLVEARRDEREKAYREALAWMNGIANPTRAQSPQAMARNYANRIAAILAAQEPSHG